MIFLSLRSLFEVTNEYLLGNLTSEKKQFRTAVTIVQAGCLSLKFAKNVVHERKH